MITYSMSQVENITGISAHTLRIWERRYSFLKPSRTKTNIRFYTDEQLKKLINIGVLNKNGHRISKLAIMPDEEIEFKASEILANTTDETEELIQGLTLSMLDLDEEKFSSLFAKYVNRRGFLSAITDLVYPFLKHVGVLWTTNKVMPAQEHFISNLIRQKIIAAIDELPLPKREVPTITLFLFEKESHEIALLLAHYIVKDLGFKASYLGQDVPTQNTKQIADTTNSKFLLTMLVSPNLKNLNEKIESLLRDNDSVLLISGNPKLCEIEKEHDRVHYIPDPKGLESYLRKYVS